MVSCYEFKFLERFISLYFHNYMMFILNNVSCLLLYLYKPNNFKLLKKNLIIKVPTIIAYPIYKITMHFKIIFLPFNEGNEGTRPDKIYFYCT